MEVSKNQESNVHEITEAGIERIVQNYPSPDIGLTIKRTDQDTSDDGIEDQQSNYGSRQGGNQVEELKTHLFELHGKDELKNEKLNILMEFTNQKVV